MSIVVEQFTISNTAGDVVDVFALANSNALTVAIVDSNGDQISSFGGGTQYTEDAVSPANPVGNAQLLVRSDTPGAISTTNGDWVAQRGTDYGASYVQVVDSSGAFVDVFGGGTQYTEDAAAAANPVGNMLLAVRADTPSAGVTDTDGDNIALRANNKGELYVKHTDALTVTGVSTAANQATEIGHLATIAGAVSGGAVVVSSNNLDIRDLLFASDKVDVTGSTVTVNALTNSSVVKAQLQDNSGAAIVLGQAVMASSLPVTLASNQSALPITDNSGSLTVDAPVGTPVFVRLSDGAAAITTLPVSVATIPSHDVTNAGTFAVQESGSALTALQLIDDVIFTDDAGFTPGSSKVAMIGFQFDDAATDSVNEGDAGAARMSANRNIYTTIRDGAGNERGANVNASNQLSTSVDNIATGNNVIGQVKITDGTDVADVLDLANSNPVVVAIVDGSGDQITSFGGGTQYTEGATDASITGTALLFEGAGDTLIAAPGTAADGLLVNLGSNNDVSLNAGDNVIGRVKLSDGTDVADILDLANSNPLTVAIVDGSGDQITSFGGGTQYTEGDTDATITGTALMMEGAGNALVAAPGTAADGLLVNLGANNDVAASQSGTWNINNVSGTISLPTGASTLAEQQTQTTALQLLDDVVATDGAAAGTKLYQVGGTDGSNAQILSTNSSGHLNIADGGNTITVDGSVSISGSVDTELPTAAALADDTANPTLPSVGSFPHWYDGSTWDRARGTSADGLLVNLGSNNDVTVTGDVNVTNSGTFAAQISGDALTALQLIDDPIIVDDNPFTPATSKVTMVGFEFDDSAPDSVNEGDGGAARMSANRNIYTQIRDAAGNERGLNIDANGALAALVSGDTAHDSADSGNPVKVGFKAINALPTAVAANDRANAVSDLWGRQLVSHIDPAQQISKSFNATTTQTGTDVWDPSASAKIAITSIIIGTYGTTAGRVILWFGDNADTTYTAGTDQLVLAASFAPSSTTKPGLVFTPAFPIFCTTADRELHITTDAGISIDVTVYGYEW